MHACTCTAFIHWLRLPVLHFGFKKRIGAEKIKELMGVEGIRRGLRAERRNLSRVRDEGVYEYIRRPEGGRIQE